MTDYQWEQVKRQTLSFSGIVPSQDLDADGFYLWLQHATPGELEEDILTEKTAMHVLKITKYEKLNEKIKEFAEEIPYEPECEPKVRYLGPLKLKVNL